ncbi:hypothetical protein [Apibacter sp. HY039]|uniref:hypothetical protein n=1 Tax=Apibacter sp. HY039 TaxID=2501476 RepID=UPI000FEB7A6A|nr:hypothetical protein [Apibacter sp. HY039]
MKRSITLILLTFTLIFTSCSSLRISRQNKRLENQVIDKLSDDKIAYQQFITLSKIICHDKFLENSSLFLDSYFEMYNSCTSFKNKDFTKDYRYVKCPVFTRLLDDDGKELRKYIYKYINDKYGTNSTEAVCNNLFLNNLSSKESYIKFIYNKKNYLYRLNYKYMNEEIDNYLMYDYILIMVD